MEDAEFRISSFLRGSDASLFDASLFQERA